MLVAVASVVLAAAAAELVFCGSLVDDFEGALEEPETFFRPGSCVMSVSCVPSAMGPSGFAAQEPSGLRASV